MSVAGESSAQRWRSAPAHEGSEREPRTRRELWVIDGGLDLATRVARFLGTTLLVTFIIGLVGALVLHATIIENQRDLDQQRADIARIGAETDSMRHELEELEAPARIVADARRLGMIDAPEVLYLSAEADELQSQTLNAAASQLRSGG